MEMVPLLSINYCLTVWRDEEEDVKMVIRVWGNEMCVCGCVCLGAVKIDRHRAVVYSVFRSAFITSGQA